MIFYGWDTRLIKMDDVPDAQCPNCQKKGTMIMSRYVKYAYVYWIPIVPFDSYGMCQCNDCDQILEYPEMPYAIQQHYDKFKEKVSLPLWSFSGIVVISLGVAWMIFSQLI